MTLMLTRENFIPVIDRLVDAKPDYIYQQADPGAGCVYANADGSPSCLIGQAIAIIDPDTFAHIAEYYNEMTPVDELAMNDVITFEDYSMTCYAGHLQDHQDCGMPWGEARTKAKSLANLSTP